MPNKNLKNYSEWNNIKDALTEAFGEYDFRKLKPFLWKDEIGDVFFMTRYMEIYLWDKITLNCYCWSSQKLSQVHLKGLILFLNWIIQQPY